MTSDHVETGLAALPGFAVDQVLGEGATSVVYRGVRDGKTFAIKMLKRTADSDHNLDATLRFRRAAATLARLRHSGLVQCRRDRRARGSAFSRDGARRRRGAITSDRAWSNVGAFRWSRSPRHWRGLWPKSIAEVSFIVT